ncbi:FecCD family ABC transporter permease [Paenibacillus turpanensis]|uniref:FecCD family ABC transporter permease n=1 Tax=Paenibacillus turpanensis TaxID=2689078 RepID=UPI001408FD89|nr:iron ABC transporter permease [Paenibacillus turpanensis]
MRNSFMQSASRFWAVLLGTVALSLAAAYIHLTNGEFDMTVMEVVRTLLRINPVPEHDLVIFEFRLPRIAIAALVGIGLGIAGAVIQGVTRNGLAEPGILGINAGAGAAIVFFMFVFKGEVISQGLGSIMAMPLFGLIGGIGAAVLIYAFAYQNGRLDPQRLVLVGIAIGTGLGALTLFIALKMNPNDFEMAVVWLTGSIWNANWVYFASMLPWFVLCIPFIIRGIRVLDLLQLEENSAKGLGVSVEKERGLLLLGSVGLVSACVSVSGSIAFIGLLSPHIAKRLVGLSHKHALPVSGAIGMLLVIGSDFIAKTVFSPAELPVGIVISIVGVPYFVYLLLKAKG